MLSTSHTRPESARPPSRLMSANAARRAITQLDHITPSAHYTDVADSLSATSLDHRQVKRWHSVPGVENSPLYFCQSSSEGDSGYTPSNHEPLPSLFREA